MADIQEVPKAQLEEFSLLLEDRTFVDYFNIFLCLPVFGQHVYYNFMDSEFEFEPPIKQRRDLYLDKRQVLLWLCKERFALFKKTSLCTEFNLCKKLRTATVHIHGIQKGEEPNDEEDSTINKDATKNILGTALGMLMFRESLRGTCGETVYRCWRDIEAWRHLEDDVRRMYWKNVIKNKYIHQDSTCAIKSRVKVLVFQGTLNFDLVPEDQVHEIVCQGLEADDSVAEVESDEALAKLQIILLDVMRKYWAPRFILHFKQTASKETMEVLTRPAPGDTECLIQERRLLCRFMFPTIAQETVLSTPTTVFVSQSADQRPPTPESEKLSSSSEEELSLFDEELNPTTLFNLWTGPARDIAVEEKPETRYSDVPSSGPTPDSPFYGERLQSMAFNTEETKIPRSPIPITLISYLGGKKRTILGKFPSIGNRLSWSLASDALAGCPFRAYLYTRGHNTDLKYLSFWTDVRNYLDTDDSTIDGYGFPLKQRLAHQFMETYLSHSGVGCDLFSESVKNSLFNALGQSNDVSLLCMAQDIVLENLWEPLKLYIQEERRAFLKQVRGYRYKIKELKTRNHLQEFNAASAAYPATSSGVDPMFFFQCTTVRRESPSDASSPFYDREMTLPSSAGSHAASSYHISISEEQMWKAMELTVLCSEYGVSMMVPQYPPTPEQLVDVLHGDYGSLHVTHVPAQRNDFLRNLMFPPKININTIRVSRKVLIEKIDLSNVEKKEKDDRIGKGRMTIRRDGVTMERPCKPKTFVEVLTTHAHYDFFKRYMMIHKATMPLLFWKAVEELKEQTNMKSRSIRVSQIMRKFFGRNGKYGAVLDCHEDIIRQIPQMEKVTPGILICAQAAVYRSMERNWYPMYMDTYPPDAAGSSPEPRSTVVTPRTKTPDIVDVVYRAKQKPKIRRTYVKKTIQLWRGIARGLVDFWRAMTNQTETQLLEIYLKCEIEKEQHSGKPDGPIEKNIMMSTHAANATQQTRVVIRNRLIILNRLPADLGFWLETQKYINLCDGASMGPDSDFLYDKARAIISCYLSSDVPPRIQVNVPNDLAANIINSLAQNGPTRGLFHDAIFLIFPALNHFWKKYSEEWKTGDIPDAYIEYIEKQLRSKISKVSEEPHQAAEVKDFTHLEEDDIKESYQMMFDESMVKIQFTISEGVVIIYPTSKPHKTSASPSKGRRLTKHTIHSTGSSASSSPQKGANSKLQLHPGDKKDTRRSKHRLERSKHKLEKLKEDEAKDKEKDKSGRDRKKRIVVKDPNEPEVSSSKSPVKQSPVKAASPGRSTRSTDRAQKLSQLVETLNTEREDRIRLQNRRYSKLMKFDEVVSAALQDISENGSSLLS